VTAAPLLQIVFRPDDAAGLDWTEQALCAQVDPEIFFPGKGGSVRNPKRICGMCEVRQPCLDYALETSQAFGIWGGFTERERRQLKRVAA
jgi:WhiB family redox-sensing transcriptional regulator